MEQMLVSDFLSMVHDAVDSQSHDPVLQITDKQNRNFSVQSVDDQGGEGSPLVIYIEETVDW